MIVMDLIFFVLVGVGTFVLPAVPFCLIARKAGLSWSWGVLGAIPMIGTLVFLSSIKDMPWPRVRAVRP